MDFFLIFSWDRSARIYFPWSSLKIMAVIGGWSWCPSQGDLWGRAFFKAETVLFFFATFLPGRSCSSCSNVSLASPSGISIIYSARDSHWPSIMPYYCLSYQFSRYSPNVLPTLWWISRSPFSWMTFWWYAPSSSADFRAVNKRHILKNAWEFFLLKLPHFRWLVGLIFRSWSRFGTFRNILQAFPASHAFSVILPTPIYHPSGFLHTMSSTSDESSDQKSRVSLLLLQNW